MKLNGQKVVVCGAGGFIGGHLVKSLLDDGVDVIRAVDIKPLDEWYQVSSHPENVVADLKSLFNCEAAVDGATVVFNLAADMGGMGFIENNKALCMLSVLTNTHLLMAAERAGITRYFYSSSACVYNGDKQKDANVVPLKESDAYPALAEDGYGWEKLFSERMCRHFERTLDYSAASHVITTSTARWAPGRADGKRRPLRSAERSWRQSIPASMKLKYGATVIKRAVLCTSMTAPKDLA